MTALQFFGSGQVKYSYNLTAQQFRRNRSHVILDVVWLICSHISQLPGQHWLAMNQMTESKIKNIIHGSPDHIFFYQSIPPFPRKWICDPFGNWFILCFDFLFISNKSLPCRNVFFFPPEFGVEGAPFDLCLVPMRGCAFAVLQFYDTMDTIDNMFLTCGFVLCSCLWKLNSSTSEIDCVSKISRKSSEYFPPCGRILGNGQKMWKYL